MAELIGSFVISLIATIVLAAFGIATSNLFFVWLTLFIICWLGIVFIKGDSVDINIFD